VLTLDFEGASSKSLEITDQVFGDMQEVTSENR
jgi:hypothetical protein